ncbi:MAG: antibiotic biosynthesis monooxygenase [Acidobacteriia bacterium]|nr:antibiotic biosynthesis monooxygenase [Terriglobia bacterium]MBV8903096.1 antibiotic biosynthesis monooxygenase [Terriglobia bacterium]
MAQTAVTVIAELNARAGKEDEARQLLLALLEPTRQEEGCIQYDLHEVVGAPGHFLFYENWRSRGALDAHLKTPHLESAFARIPELFEASPRVLISNRIG